RGLLRLLDRVIQRRVAARVAAAGARRNLDVLDQLCEQLAALCVDDRLLVLGRGPLGVAGHISSAPSPCPRSNRAPAGHRSARGGTTWPAGRAAGPRRSYPRTGPPRPCRAPGRPR